jgi:hypothetical protein
VETPPETAAHARTGARARRNQVLAGAAMALMVTGLVLAAIQPPWLTEPLQAAVANAGAAAPLVFVVLTVLLVPLHLSGVLIVLSTVVWSLPVAWGLSFAGSVLGCVLTAVVLARAGATPDRSRDGWPPWLVRFSGRVGRRPYLVGIVTRVVLHSGIALEAFYLLTGYTRRQYLVTTSVGVAVWITQALTGVLVLTALAQISPVFAVLGIAVPIGLIGIPVLVRRRRAAVRPHS